MMRGRVHTIRNDFFGETVTVSGLVTGGDIIAQLKDFDLGSRLLIPRNMLRSGEDVFLDDVTVGGLSEALRVPVTVVGTDGADLLRAFLGG
jgi:NifB/MoaA-like Fe-S oxidoreductase